MLNFLDEDKFKKVVKWAILSMLFFQAFPLIYFGYDLGHPTAKNFWTAGLAFPALVSIIGIIKPELVVKSLLDEGQQSPDKINSRGRRYAIITLLLFVGAMILIRVL